MAADSALEAAGRCFAGAATAAAHGSLWGWDRKVRYLHVAAAAAVSAAGEPGVLVQTAARMAGGWGGRSAQMAGPAPATAWEQAAAAAAPDMAAMLAWGLLDCSAAPPHPANAAAAAGDLDADAGLGAIPLGSWPEDRAAVPGAPLQAASEASGTHCQARKLAGEARQALRQAAAVWRQAAARACAAKGAAGALWRTHQAELA